MISYDDGPDPVRYVPWWEGKEGKDYQALLRVARAAEKVEPYGPEDAVKEFCDALEALPGGLLDE